MPTLIQINPLLALARFDTAPLVLKVPTIGEVFGAAVGWTQGNYTLVDTQDVGAATDQFSVADPPTVALQNGKLVTTTTYKQRAPTKAELISYCANKRSSKALLGTALGATPIPTDMDTRTLLLLAYTKASADNTFTMPWNGATLTAANIIAAARQVGIFLAGVLVIETNTKASINAGTITTIAQIDAAFA